jgi:hypothetical protein
MKMPKVSHIKETFDFAGFALDLYGPLCYLWTIRAAPQTAWQSYVNVHVILFGGVAGAQAIGLYPAEGGAGTKIRPQFCGGRGEASAPKLPSPR